MRASIAAAGLLCLISATSARADEIKDLDKWARDFTDAVGRTDASAMMALVRPYVAPRFNLDPVDKENQTLTASFGKLKSLYSEQFSPSQIGSFIRRINVVVVYEDTQMFYDITFLRRYSGWQIVNFHYGASIDDILKRLEHD